MSDVMWGDPPKPNLWVKDDVMYGWEKITRVFSPVLKGEIWCSNNGIVLYFPKGLGLPQRKLGRDYDLRGLNFARHQSQRLKDADSGEHFLSHAYWSEHIRGNVEINVPKVASDSSSLKVMWGDPPKPNIWQITHTPPLLTRKKSENWVIQSPLLKDSFNIYKRGQTGRFDVYYGAGLSKGKVLGNDGDWYLEYILSNDWYMEYIKPLLESGDIRMKNNNIKLASDIDLMWGDPPKPNLWGVERSSKNTFLITSPLFKKLEGLTTALRIEVSSGYNSRLNTFRPVGQVTIVSQDRNLLSLGSFDVEGIDLPVVNNKVILNPAAVLASSLFWESVVKPALKRAKALWSHGDFLTTKVASTSKWFPSSATQNPLVTLNWGTPPKPNIWSAWRGDSGDFYYYYIESPLLSDTCIEIYLDYRSSVAEIYFREDGFMEKVKHIQLKGRNALDEIVRGNKFWNTVLYPLLKEHGHLNNVKVASKSTKRTKATKSTKRTKATKSTKRTKATKTTKTTKATKATKATKSAKTTKATKPTKRTKATKTTKATKPTKRTKATKATKAINRSAVRSALVTKLHREASTVLSKAKELNTALFRRNMTLENLKMAYPFDSFPRLAGIDNAIATKDYASLEVHGKKLKQKFDEDYVSELEWCFGYMLSSIIPLSKLLGRQDVYGQQGFRKFKQGWAKFKRSAKAEWDEINAHKATYSALEGSTKKVSGVTLRFYFGEKIGGWLAKTSTKDGSIGFNLSKAGSLLNGNLLKVMLSHELIHVQQIADGNTSAGAHDSYGYHTGVGYALAEIEYDPRISDSTYAVEELMQDHGNSLEEAISKITGKTRLLPSEESTVTDMVEEWFKVLREYDPAKFQRAVRDVRGRF